MFSVVIPSGETCLLVPLLIFYPQMTTEPHPLLLPTFDQISLPHWYLFSQVSTTGKLFSLLASICTMLLFVIRTWQIFILLVFFTTLLGCKLPSAGCHSIYSWHSESKRAHIGVLTAALELLAGFLLVCLISQWSASSECLKDFPYTIGPTFQVSERRENYTG